MTSNKNSAKRMKLLMFNYLEAKKSGSSMGFDIAQVSDDNFEEYYILLKPETGLYRNQNQILHLKTSYGSGQTYSYPLNAPFIKFLTPCFHVNVSINGSICLDILTNHNKWSPMYSFSQVIQNIVLLYQSPNNSSPYNGEASRIDVNCNKKFKELKIKDMPLADEEILKDNCFMPFKIKADKYAMNVDINKYNKWFPQITGNKIDQEELDNLQSLYDSMKSKSKSKSKSDETKDEDETKIESSKNPVVKKNKWDKYKKKSLVVS